MARAIKQELPLEERLAQALVPDEDKPHEVPENWVWVRLEYLVSIKTGKKDANYGTENGKYPFYTCASEPIRCDGYSFEGESILLAGNGANVGLSLYFDGKFEAYQRTYVIQHLVPVCLKYIFFHFQCFWKTYNSDKQYGTATNYIKLDNFQKYPLPLPPLAEQRRIVERIESLFEKLDRAKELAQNALDSFETRKAAILHKAFAGELTAKWRKEKGVDIESWSICALGSVMLPMKTKKPQGVIFRYIDIDSINNELQKVDAPKVLLTSKAPSRASREVQKGDTLFSMVRPYLKNIAYINDSLAECIASTGFYVCKPSDKINSMFLYRFLTNDEVIMEINSYMKGDNSPSVRKEDIESIPINLPTISEQHEIVRILDSLFQKEQHAKELTDVIEKIDLIKKAILVRAFRGELGTNNSLEESAIELLKEVLSK